MWRSHGPTELDDPDPSIRVYTKEELDALGKDRDLFTRVVLNAVCELFPNEAQNDVQDKGLPFAAVDPNNEFADALQLPVPLNRYQQSNVFWFNTDGQIQFHKWLYRLAFTKSVNRFATYYNRVNRSPNNIPFPKDQFMSQLRRIKARGYQRDHRSGKPHSKGSTLRTEDNASTNCSRDS